MDIGSILLNALGLTATGFSVLMWVPQARITWQSRNDPSRLAGISETTQWLLMGGYLLWGVFGVLSDSLWVAAPSVVAFPLALASIVIVRRGRRLPLTVSVPIISASETHSDLDGAGEIDAIPMAESLTSFDMTASIPIITSESAPESLATGTIPIMASEPTDADVAPLYVSTHTGTIVQQPARVSAPA